MTFARESEDDGELSKDSSIEEAIQFLRSYMVPGTELAINDPGRIWQFKAGIWSAAKDPVITAANINRLAVAIASRSTQKIGRHQPLMGATFLNKIRAQFVYPPIVDFPSMTMRIPPAQTEPFTIESYKEKQFFNDVIVLPDRLSPEDEHLLDLKSQKEWEEFFLKAVSFKKNILLAGKTHSGKSEFTKMLIRYIAHNERLLSIEDARELVFMQENVVTMVYPRNSKSDSAVQPVQLLEAANRMTADRLFLGEVRAAEAYEFIKAATSGMQGSFTTNHAGNCWEAQDMMANYLLQGEAGRAMGYEVCLRKVMTSLDVVAHLKMLPQGRRLHEVDFEPERKIEMVRKAMNANAQAQIDAYKPRLHQVRFGLSRMQQSRLSHRVA